MRFRQSPSLLSRCLGFDRQCVDALVHQVAERGIDHPLALDTRFAGEGGAFDRQAEVTFPGGIVAAVPAVLLAVVGELEPIRRQRRIEPAQHFARNRAGSRGVHGDYIVGANERVSVATKQSRLHGRVEGARARCAVPGCGAAGEFKAPLQPANFDGPGAWRFLCLDHVREHNAKYNFFDGMSSEEIQEAQSPLAGWERPSRKFAANGADPAPKWSDCIDPLDAIGTRFRRFRDATPSRFSRTEQRALSVLGLGEEADRHSIRQRYSALVRRYHPDKNGGDRSHEARLAEVIDAYQMLRKAPAFA